MHWRKAGMRTRLQTAHLTNAEGTFQAGPLLPLRSPRMVPEFAESAPLMFALPQVMRAASPVLARVVAPVTAAGANGGGRRQTQQLHGEAVKAF